MRICIPFFLYVVVTFSMIIYGCDQIAHCPHRQVCGPGPQTDIFKRRSEITGRLNMAQVAMFVGIVCGIATIVGSTLAIVLKAKRTRRAQIDSVAALVELATKAEISQKGSSEQDVSRRASSWADVTAAIFHAFDLEYARRRPSRVSRIGDHQPAHTMPRRVDRIATHELPSRCVVLGCVVCGWMVTATLAPSTSKRCVKS
jgi:hypothetical protein